MSKYLNRIRPGWLFGGMATIVLGALLLAFPVTASAVEPDYSDYEGSEFCAGCHEENYNLWQVSGHPYKLMKSEEARNRPIPLPEGITWDDVSYVIGGYKWKSRYIDDQGYIITSVGEDRDIPGQNQYNMLVGYWSDYNAGVENKPYNCGSCHTTAWIADEDHDTDNDLTDNQDGLPGMHGTFFAGGIHCEECHGPGFASMEIDDSAAFCGECHYRGDLDTIPASGGWIRHHEQYNEQRNGAHGEMDCVRCHNPHVKSDFSIKETGTCGVSCHSNKMESFMKTSMFDYGVTCEDCHMPLASKSAQPTGPHQGDVMTHILRINTDPTADMFTEDGSFVQLDENGKAAVTLDFACQGCHVTASLDELALYAKDFHDENKGLEDIGLDPGLTGTWWKVERGGEGVLLEVGYIGGELFFFASFYTYGPDGEQVWLTAQMSSQDGIRANVNVFMPSGAMWGENFDPADVTTTPWGSGYFEFSKCGNGKFDITPNQAMMDMGFTQLTYELTRIMDPGIACPTFVNNEMAAAMKAAAQ